MGRELWMKDPTGLTYRDGIRIFVWIRRPGWLGGIGGMSGIGVALLTYFFSFNVHATCSHDRDILVNIGYSA
jgi:hypothetical protein